MKQFVSFVFRKRSALSRAKGIIGMTDNPDEFVTYLHH